LAGSGSCAWCRPRRAAYFPVTSWADYGPPLDRILTHLKYRPDRDLADRFAEVLGGVFVATGWTADLILPVPLGSRRRRQRGYNQVELVSQAVGKRLNLPVLPSALVRIRETNTQVGLNPAEREQNVAGAFAADPVQVRGRSPLLVDDVFTTGATLSACADALQRAGASVVFGLTIARA
jgi:ComF family protein